jgi:hypothetical protein
MNTTCSAGGVLYLTVISLLANISLVDLLTFYYTKGRMEQVHSHPHRSYGEVEVAAFKSNLCEVRRLTDDCK